MADLKIDPHVPEITPDLRLIGWHREFCVELLGDGVARVFVRAVEASSFKATELQRAILFQRLDSRFTDLPACVDFIRTDLTRLADTARRHRPTKDNLYTTLEYDRATWERVQSGVESWARR